jgi:nitrate/nitrite transport system permease protein
MKKLSVKAKGAILSLLILLTALLIWHISTVPKVVVNPVTASGSSEYQALMGQSSSGETTQKSGFPSLTMQL